MGRFRHFFSRKYGQAFFDFLLPPRPSERLLRGLRAEEFGGLVTERFSVGGEFKGLLPYYDPRVTALVWELKYHRSYRAAALAAALMAQEIMGIAQEGLSPPILVPIPMHAERKRARGYNQTEILCAAILQHLPTGSVQYIPQALLRIKNTQPQQGLTRKNRLENMRGSMEAAGAKLLAGKTCIVVDDVATTGATLQEARRALSASGVARVYCLTLAG